MGFVKDVSICPTSFKNTKRKKNIDTNNKLWETGNLVFYLHNECLRQECIEVYRRCCDRIHMNYTM